MRVISNIRRACLRAFALVGLFALQAALSHAQEEIAIKNPGFEEAMTGWTASPDDTKGGLSQVVAEAAHSGSAGLCVKQDATGPGSWLQSGRSEVQPNTAYTLSFWARCVEESGLGVWVQFYSSDRKPIQTPSQVISLVPANSREWTECRLEIRTPENAQFITFAVHCFSKRVCHAYIDDFSLKLSTGAPAPVAEKKGPEYPKIDPARIKEIAVMLDAKPRGIGPSLSDRKVWDALAADAAFKEKTIALATRFTTEPIPEVTREAYEASAKTGDRKDNVAIDRRRFRMVNFVLAEGMENQGRFLPFIDKEILAICSEHTWILSGHAKFIKANDLGTAMTAWNLASAVTILGDKLPEETRKLVRDEVQKRVISTYLDQLHGKMPSDFWRIDEANWNAVVHAGITGAALALVDSPEERAEIIAAAEVETPYYIKGFPSDGYSYEGMGYWKYGFGHYVMLAESVLAATHGKVNFYAMDAIPLLAQFPRRFEVTAGIYPAYSDAQFLEQPSLWLYNIIDGRYGLADHTPRTLPIDGVFCAFLYSWAINLSFDPSAAPVYQNKGVVISGHRLRDWFDKSQVLVARMPEGKPGLSFSFKGGNNGTSHNHNDLGTFLTVVDGQPITVDPGVTVYDARTFGPQRFDIQVISSYGHSLPRVAGQLQKFGKQYHSEVVDSKFSDTADTVTLDLTKAYEVPVLKKLTRRFDYSRQAKGELLVTDEVQFSSPQAFGTALSTYGEAREEKPGVWIISYKGKELRVQIDAGGVPFTVTNEVLKDEARFGKVRSLGIVLNDSAAQAKITVRLTPL